MEASVEKLIRKLFELGNVEIKENQMLYNTVQAAEKLGGSHLQVKTLIKHGFLADAKPRDPKRNKHYSLISSKEISRFISEHGKLNGARRIVTSGGNLVIKPRTDKSPNLNLNLKEKEEPDFTVQPSTGFSARISALESAIRELEKKIDLIIRMWT